KIDWKSNTALPRTTFGEEHNSLTGLVGGGGSGIETKDGKLVFPVEGTKKKDNTETDVKIVSLIIRSSDAESWTLLNEISADGCGDPSIVEWKDGKLMMMTACDDGPRRVYESGDKGESWTEALGTLSRVWGNEHEGPDKGVRSGVITATVGNGADNRNVMLVTLPVYARKADTEVNGKGELHLWLTDNTHIVDIGPVSGNDDVAASSLLYKSGGSGTENDELIVLYEKKKGSGKPSLGMVSVLLTEQLKRVKEVLATWKKVDDTVSQLCSTSSAAVSAPIDTACSTNFNITAGLVGFLSGNFSGKHGGRVPRCECHSEEGWWGGVDR
ncbi:trans-sialidase, putative, partial [Trypanosoma cruzi marinkellei]